MQHGGTRPGAGRPRSVARSGKDNEIVTKKLKGGAQAGWEVLAEEYPSLIRLAVEFAKDPNERASTNQKMKCHCFAKMFGSF